MGTFTVTTTSDSGAGLLRAAIAAASTAGGMNTITFAAGTFPTNGMIVRASYPLIRTN